MSDTGTNYAKGCNFERAMSAEAAVKAYASVKEFFDVTDTTIQLPQEWLTDLLADLRHWARNEGLDFAEANRIAETHFTEEVDEETTEDEGEDDDETGGET